MDAMYERDPNDAEYMQGFKLTKYPKQTPEAAYLRQQLKAYDNAVEQLDAKIKELRDKFMAMG